MPSNYIRMAVAAVLLATAAAAHAADEPKKSAVSGLPEGTDLNLTFSAGWGYFGFGKSLGRNPQIEVSKELSSNWMQGSAKGGFGLSPRFTGGSDLCAALPGVGETRRYGPRPPGWGD